MYRPATVLAGFWAMFYPLPAHKLLLLTFRLKL